MAAAAGALIGKTIDGWRNDHMAERDAVLRRYVELHPDDFPDPGINNCSLSQPLLVIKTFSFVIIERKKFSELLLPWVPIR